MTKSIPQIRRYMTTEVHTIGDEQPMSVAHRMMRERRIRHLPVLHRGKLVGVVNDRDLRLSETLQELDPRKITVSEAMSRNAYVVGPDAGLDEVLRTMAEQQYGSAVVTDRGRIVGIFTAVDACVAFADLLANQATH
jgi:acetoin utilization protein AcuB